VPERLTDGKSIIGGQGTAEAPAECAALTKRPAAEYWLNVNPSSNGNISPQAWGDRSNREAGAAGDADRLPRCDRGNLATRNGDSAVAAESEGGASGRAFE
jgi:hypothetical protein